MNAIDRNGFNVTDIDGDTLLVKYRQSDGSVIFVAGDTQSSQAAACQLTSDQRIALIRHLGGSALEA